MWKTCNNLPLSWIIKTFRNAKTFDTSDLCEMNANCSVFKLEFHDFIYYIHFIYCCSFDIDLHRSNDQYVNFIYLPKEKSRNQINNIDSTKCSYPNSFFLQLKKEKENRMNCHKITISEFLYNINFHGCDVIWFRIW